MNIPQLLEKTGQTEQSILREHFLFQAFAKLSRYQSECRLFEKKYGASLAVIQARNTDTGTEDFALEDDLLDWEYAHAAWQWWQGQLQEFRDAA